MPSTSRQRLFDALEFKSPDKMPVIYHASHGGLFNLGDTLLKLFKKYPPDNAKTFDVIPRPDAGTIDESGRYYEVKKDEWGTGWEYLIFGIEGHPTSFPFENWDAAADYTFPPLPAPEGDYEQLKKEGYPAIAWGGSIFEKLHALRPMDENLVDLLTEEEGIYAFLDRLVDYWLEVIQRDLDAGADIICFGDDWGTQDAPIISPALFKEVFKPRYEKLFAPVKAAGKYIFFHSCGCLDGVLDDLIELGVTCFWPQIKLFESKPETLQKCIDNKVSIYIHPDRQSLIPFGTPEEIEVQIKKYADRYHQQGGGGIFYVEIENDAPLENAQALIEAVDKYR